MNSPKIMDQPNNGKSPRKVYKRRYTPPCEIRDMPGVRKTQDLHEDRYSGTKDDLVAMGLLPSKLFPGEPDMPAGGVTLWPPEAKHGGGWFYPGRMQVTRTAAGTFTIRLAVSAEEQARRMQEEDARRAHRRQEERVHQESEQNRPAYESAEDFLKWKIFEIKCAARMIRGSEEKNCHYALEPSLIDAVTKKLLEAEYLLRSARVVDTLTSGTYRLRPNQSDGTRRSGSLRLVHSSAGIAS